jgi:hypothetical protein
MNRDLLVLGIGAAMLISINGCHHDVAATEEMTLVRVSDWSVPSVAQQGSPIQITLEVQSGGCITFKRVEVLRTESQVTIRAWGTSPPPIPGVGVMLACPRTFPQTEVVQLEPPFLRSFTVVVEEPGAWPNLSAAVTVQ